MMDAFHRYFDYVCLTGCGIPDITLLGTVDDWQSIYTRVEKMDRYHLSWWIDRLLPICQEFINAAAGEPTLEFWRCIYKPEVVYSAEYVTGWLADLFPYLQHPLTKIPTLQNHLLLMDCCQLPIAEQETEAESSMRFFEPMPVGISLDTLPLGLSQVAFKLKVEDAECKEAYDLNLVAGFIGVHQDTDRGALKPEVGWAVQQLNNQFEQLLDKIQQQHLTQPPVDWSTVRLGSIPKELIQMLDRFDGAILYPNSGNAWQILSEHSWGDEYEVSEAFCYFLANPFIDLEDGRCIAFNFNFRSNQCWFLLGKKEDRFQNSIVIAKSIPQLFEQILAAEGRYYFDEPNFVISDSSSI
jgi:hypothetical protein